MDFYAPQSILDQKGRRILMAWMANWSSAKYKKKDALYFGAMCLPREMKYNGSRWIQGPIEEFIAYRDKEINKDLMVSAPVQIEGISGRIFDLNLSFKNQKGLKFTIECAKKEDHSFVIEYNEDNNTLSLDRSFDGNCVDILHTRKKILFSKKESVSLRIIMDKDYIEIFVNDGEDAFSTRTFAPKENTDISFSSNLETLTKIKFYTLKK
ncbi:MAG: GH32 C-terminal domain-containing protein [Firmicutes bacterium]|nr:GH32 C-terminal domain-containing protein [Bacillota bacterium]